MAHFAAGAFLAAGQVNTIAHQGIQLIDQKILEADQSTVTFSNIDQGYESLWLLMSAGVDSTTARVLVAQFNGDTGSNYISHRVQHLDDGTGATAYDDPASYIAIGVMNTNLLALNSVFFPGYSRTDRSKSVLSTFSAPGADSYLGFCGGEWNSTSAITEITIGETLLDGSRPILAGSVFTLYGLDENTQ